MKKYLFQYFLPVTEIFTMSQLPVYTEIFGIYKHIATICMYGFRNLFENMLSLNTDIEFRESCYRNLFSLVQELSKPY